MITKDFEEPEDSKLVPESDESIQPVPKSILSLVLRVLLAFTALVIVALAVPYLNQEIDLTLISPFLVLAGVLVFTSTFVMRSLRWRLILAQDSINISLLDSLSMVYGAHFYHMILPARSGEVSRFYLLKQYNVSLSTFGAAVIFEYILDLSLILAIGFISFTMLFFMGFLTLESIVTLAFASAVLIGGVLLISLANSFLRRGEKDKNKEDSSILGRLRHLLLETSSIGHLATTNKNRSLAILVLSVLVWIGEIGFIWFVAFFVGVPISPEFAFLAGAVGAVAQAFPILPGSWGSYEILVGLTLAAGGITFTVGVSIAILDHLLRTAHNLIAGLPFIFHMLGRS